MSNGVKKPSRVGRTSGCFGMLIFIGVLLITFAVVLGPGHDIKFFFKMMVTLFKMSPALLFLIGGMVLLGGGSIGLLMGGGKKMAQTTEISDLERL